MDLGLFLKSHEAENILALNITGKAYAILDLRLEFGFGHIRFMPPVGGNYAFIGACRIINDIEDFLKVFSRSLAYHRFLRLLQIIRPLPLLAGDRSSGRLAKAALNRRLQIIENNRSAVSPCGSKAVQVRRSPDPRDYTSNT